jgi:V/A-type H+-transporting ATPase subunit D
MLAPSKVILMADLRRVPPGRAGRLWLLHRKQIAERGIELLDRKLRILRAEQQRFHLIEQDARERWERSASVARQWLVRAAVLGGQRDLRHATPDRPATVRLTWAAVMGVRYPAEAKCLLPPQDPAVSGAGNSALTPAVAAHRDALQAGAAHAIALAACAAIDAEVVEVRRRLTAIRDRWLPRLEQALREFERSLEETERSEVARLRRLVRPTH